MAMADGKRLMSVGIIGAGPSGLISAHHFLNPPSTFKVTIFEKSTSPCGLWPTSKHDNSRLIDPLMRTNQSVHTVQFGAFGQRFYEKEEGDNDQVDVLPRAWQVGRYLKRLADEVVHAGARLELQAEVISVEKTEDALKKSEKMAWKVKVRKVGESQEEEHTFDHLIIASGFFGTPKIPVELQPYLSTSNSTPSSSPVPLATTLSSPLGIPVIHSSSLRTLTNLLDSSPTTPSSISQPGKRKILVVGGSMSGAEAASALASELSSLQHSPVTSPLPNPSSYEIIHIASHPFWTLPRYLPLQSAGTEAAPQFLPLDSVLFNLSTREAGTLGMNTAGVQTHEAARKVHGYFSALSGREKPHAWQDGDKDTDAPWLGICDNYTTHAVSGNITTVRGRLTTLSASGPTADDGSGSGNVTAIISTPSGEEKMDNVAAVILATGFSPTTSLSFLSSSILATLNFKPQSIVPLKLAWHDTISKDFPTLGFVGMYCGPFWGVIEQQALLLRELWLQLDDQEVGDLPQRLREAEGNEELRRVEEEQGRERIAQFPMGDYLHVMSSLLSLRGKTLALPPKSTPCWPLIPDAFDLPISRSTAEADAAASSPARLAVQHTVARGITGHFFPRSLFRALNGQWKLERRITSRHPSYPSGTLTGSAVFHPRKPTEGGYSGEYLFTEEGGFRTEGGVVMRAARRYVWRLKNGGKEGDGDGEERQGDKLSQWFVKVDGAEKGRGVDYLFHELDILSPSGRSLATRSEVLDGASCPRSENTTTTTTTAAAAETAASEKQTQTQTIKNAVTATHLWTAQGHHLCLSDTYVPRYTFHWRGAELEAWELAYTVSGPEKEYFIHSTFSRV